MPNQAAEQRTAELLRALPREKGELEVRPPEQARHASALNSQAWTSGAKGSPGGSRSHAHRRAARHPDDRHRGDGHDNNNAEKLGVGRIKPDGTLKEFKVPGGPWSIVAGPDGNLWVSLPYIGIGRVTPKGKVTVYKDVGPNPTAVAAGFGKLWLVTDNNGAIARIDVPAR